MKRTLLIALLAAFTGLSANATDLPGSEHVAGGKLNKTKCARCHKLYHPKDYEPAEWDRWLQKMKQKAPPQRYGVRPAVGLPPKLARCR